MKISNLTAIVFTYNEEKRIERVLNNFNKYCELLIIDNYSTDKTCSIIENTGIKVVQIQNKGHLDRKNIEKILAIVNTDWLFFIQCSEVIPTTLFFKINTLIDSQKYRAILLNRISYTGGTLTHNQKKFYKNIINNLVYTRLFNRKYLNIDLSKIHYEFPIEINDKFDVAILSPDKFNSIIHLRDLDIEIGENKHIKYSKFDAEQIYESGKRGSYFRVIFRPIKSILFFINYDFIKNYNYYKFLTLIQYYQYILSVELKLLELTKGENLISCSTKNNNIIKNFITNVE